MVIGSGSGQIIDPVFDDEEMLSIRLEFYLASMSHNMVVEMVFQSSDRGGIAKGFHMRAGWAGMVGGIWFWRMVMVNQYGIVGGCITKVVLPFFIIVRAASATVGKDIKVVYFQQNR